MIGQNYMTKDAKCLVKLGVFPYWRTRRSINLRRPSATWRGSCKMANGHCVQGTLAMSTFQLRAMMTLARRYTKS